ncbi:pentatricopeptide repeat-containing At4g02750-like [Olea europaea subsp. europaea]|uniref:Pentatricopeptide repeat-containing At4g02750-like n=2 Tax=Olea europaea subsp. europaea TaxID=158383 RepID=A0A8S0S275_OLEEU|nr:pentatricopeptide repeat-containing At4g02750-like [Olea europaea subsp. europaea]
MVRSISDKINRAVKNFLLPRHCVFFLRCPEQYIYHHVLYTTATTTSYNNPSLRNEISFKFANRDSSSTFSNSNLTYYCNVRLSELGRLGKVNEARKLFGEMTERDTASYSSMIAIYLKNNDLHKAEGLFREMPDSKRNIVADSAMIHAYVEASKIDEAQKIFDQMPVRNAFSWTSLISGYFKIGKIDDARELFDKMPKREKNVVTWTNIILGYARNGLIDEARDAFDQMPAKNVVAWTAMISAYFGNNQVDKALEIFYMMPQPNLYSWNVIIKGCLDDNRVNEAKKLFDSMPWKNVVSWTTMVMGLARNGMSELARKYFDQMPNKDIAAWNAMITAYANGGQMVKASELFHLMPTKNFVTWNAMIDGYAKNCQESEAFKHFVLMFRSCTWPNEKTLTSLLISCESTLGVSQAHGLVVQLGFELDTYLTNALVTMYYRSGDVRSARIAFDNLEAKDIVSWTSMILAFSNHGYGNRALETFARMLRSGNKPDEITFVGVLSACSHAGLVKKGQMLFDSMRCAYGLEPKAEHYSCLTDILGRAGLVDEAVKVVHQMPPCERDGTVLGALLGACKLHGDVGLADYIGDELLELEPASSGGYVLLASMYAACGKWDEFAQLRKKMKERKVKKVPGFSQIEVNGKSHVFLVGDRSHPEMEKIYTVLQDKLLPLMQEKGYKNAILPAMQ